MSWRRSAWGPEGIFFTTPHLDGYAPIVVRLGRIDLEGLDEVIVEAWLARAPKRLARTTPTGDSDDWPRLERPAADLSAAGPP